MAGNPFLQDLDPASPPDPITPTAGPGSHGTAPYDIQADNGEAAITSAFNAANALTGAGVLYSMGPRQQEAQHLLDSPQGFSAGAGLSGYDIMSGWSGEPDESFPNNVQPGALLETPIQGQMGSYPVSNTYQDGLQKYGTD